MRPHTPPPPPPPPPKRRRSRDLTPTVRHGARELVHTGGEQVTHRPTPSTGTGILGDLKLQRPSLCRCNARSGGGRSGSGPNLTFTHRTSREGCSALATPPPLCMRGGGRSRTTSHLLQEVSCVKGRKEGLATLNQTLLRRTPSCWSFFLGGGRTSEPPFHYWCP